MNGPGSVLKVRSSSDPKALRLSISERRLLSSMMSASNCMIRFLGTPVCHVFAQGADIRRGTTLCLFKNANLQSMFTLFQVIFDKHYAGAAIGL